MLIVSVSLHGPVQTSLKHGEIGWVFFFKNVYQFYILKFFKKNLGKWQNLQKLRKLKYLIYPLKKSERNIYFML